MIKLLPLSLALAFCFCLWNCKPREATTTEKSSYSLAPSNGGTVLIAKILEISNQRSDVYPCSEVPCLAKVQIEKVEKVSANLMEPYTSGQEGNMRFEFSLNKTTKELFPNLDKRFPGLKVGDRFKANATQEIIYGSNKVQWVALDYILLP